ncbi:hypothetical protein GGI25_004278 [Coemansia spiralis]|uniref:FYR N-terminal domain-containing protein n=2 Tax=Coemansia TaxID=4863 RepID=A0A9W8G6Y6_9FUNG|nr:hypothetical protein BX070DRAFT_224973 [Coemansia spiralis]KAJ1990478.1 hypothetical protein EDC05_004018 [Coemansia umbellata]KAJ2620784.1 hypothetical protein GGI26_004679 [Coemansia sp. RSA 1358]KAJ2674626.1 hypothetical protein GGI25_004278 [Coemansia spiralis]
MLSYRELASDLTNKVKSALERRNELVKTYQGIKEELRMARAENDHLLDMLTEAYPEVAEDLSSSGSDEDMSQADNGADGNNGQQNGSLFYSSRKHRIDPSRPSGFENERELAHDDMPLSDRRHRNKRDRSSPSLGLLDATPRMTKRRRRQGKRDDRNDPKPIEPLKRDAEGRLVFPIVVGRGQDRIEVHDLGRVIWEPETYHTTRYIWAPGFRSTRVYPSIRHENSRCVYTSEILEGDGDSPVFQVTASDMPDEPFRASSSSGVWKQILDILTAKGIGVKTHASGPQMYGLSHLGITKAIQELDNAGRCSRYIMQKWIEAGEDDDSFNYDHAEDTFAPNSASVHKDHQLSTSDRDDFLESTTNGNRNPPISPSTSPPFEHRHSADDSADSANE